MIEAAVWLLFVRPAQIATAKKPARKSLAGFFKGLARIPFWHRPCFSCVAFMTTRLPIRQFAMEAIPSQRNRTFLWHSGAPGALREKYD
jgi:hypothetical protein